MLLFRILTASFILLEVSLSALTPQQQAIQIYYESLISSPAETIQAYQRLQQEELEPWQRVIVTLNLTSLMLEEREWKEAAPLLESVEWKETAPQAFSNAYWQNRARLHWLEAISQLKSPYLGDQQDGLDLLNLAKRELKLSHQTESGWIESIDRLTGKTSQPIGNEETYDPSFKRFIIDLINEEQKVLRQLLWKQAGRPWESEPASLQQQLLKEADLFWPNLLKREEVLYSKKRLCQCRPWDRVIPLFEKGYASAEQAKEMLTNQPAQIGAAAGLIRQALFIWREMLELIDEQQSELPPEANPSDPASVKQIWRSLQQTSSSEVPSQPEGVPPPPKGDHPW